MAWQGEAWHGKARQGRRGEAWPGKAGLGRRGKAGRGWAGQGEADRQGWAFEAFNRGVEADIGWSTYSVTECTGDWNN